MSAGSTATASNALTLAVSNLSLSVNTGNLVLVTNTAVTVADMNAAVNAVNATAGLSAQNFTQSGISTLNGNFDWTANASVTVANGVTVSAVTTSDSTIATLDLTLVGAASNLVLGWRDDA